MQSDVQRKKIGFLVTKGVWGGAQKYVFNLAVNLPKDRFDVFVVTGEGASLKAKLEQEGIRVYEVLNLKRDISLLSEIKSFFSIFKIIWKEKPDVLHLNSPKASGLGAVIGRILFVKQIIQTIHGWSFNEERGPFSKMLIVFFSWLTLILCHKTIVISEKEKRQAKSFPFISDRKLVLIHNGIEKIEFKEKNIAREEIQKMLGTTFSEETVWIGTIGELHRNKGLEYAISAVSKLTETYIFFVLGGGEEKERLEKRITDLNLQNKIFLLGFVSSASSYLKAFDIFTLTSVKEGLPYVLLEAGQASLPVIASAVGGIPDVIQNGTTGILTAKTKIPEITRGLAYLITNPKEAGVFAKNLKEKVEKSFSLEKMLEETKKLY